MLKYYEIKFELLFFIKNKISKFRFIQNKCIEFQN